MHYLQLKYANIILAVDLVGPVDHLPRHAVHHVVPMTHVVLVHLLIAILVDLADLAVLVDLVDPV